MNLLGAMAKRADGVRSFLKQTFLEQAIGAEESLCRVFHLQRIDERGRGLDTGLVSAFVRTAAFRRRSSSDDGVIA